jgi:nifR3 family TIM-barrel protein
VGTKDAGKKPTRKVYSPHAKGRSEATPLICFAVLRIGPVQLDSNLLLAPIAGYCDLAFRTVCREWGGVGLACTDLLSPQGLLRGTATSLDLAKTNAFDKPVGMQLYGGVPDIMAQGARWAAEHGATVIDINMGCPVDKVTKKDGGSALLTKLDVAVEIARRVRKELDTIAISPSEWAHRLRAREGDAHVPKVPTTIPLTCKMRLCWSTSDFEAGAACSPHLARMLADVGVAAVTVHGRTTEMKFQGSVQLQGITRVVESVRGQIPVIGNGDVRSPLDAARMLRETGCQGIMIGRAALSAPWLFREVDHYLRTGELLPDISLDQKIDTVLRYFALMREHRDDRYAMWQLSRRISWFAKKMQARLPDGRMESIKPLRETIRTATSPEQFINALETFRAGGLRGDAEERTQEHEAVEA